MLVSEDDDLGEFNDSVLIHPIKLINSRTTTSFHTLPHRQKNHLGIYEAIKLSHLMESNSTCQLINLISIDQSTLMSSFTSGGQELLQRYSTDELAFVLVLGDSFAGKSLFCDKILNLAEVKGNHFSRSHSVGVNIWSTPFVKDHLKIFLLELSGCNVASKQFNILSTFVMLMCSAIIHVGSINPTTQNSFQALDQSLQKLLSKISQSRIQEANQIIQKRNYFMPEIIVNLSRQSQPTIFEKELSVLKYFREEKLPNAMNSSYLGESTDLVKISFMDVNCLNEGYIRRVAEIFQSVYSEVSQKKYNELVLNGNIAGKVMKYIEQDVNNNRVINLDRIYQNIIEDLYLSAYNFCLLSYHEELQAEFEDERPKSLDNLLSIFESTSLNVFNKFNQFTLDKELHQKYELKLERHINQKEALIMDINRRKTQIQLLQFFQEIQFYQPRNLTNNIHRIQAEKYYLDHGIAQVLENATMQIFQGLGSSNNVDYRMKKEIQKCEKEIEAKSEELRALKSKNEVKNKERSGVEEERGKMIKKERQVDERIVDLKNALQHSMNLSQKNIHSYKEDQVEFERKIQNNEGIIKDLQSQHPQKHQAVLDKQRQIEDTRNKIRQQEIIIRELNSKIVEDFREIPQESESKKKIDPQSNLKNSKKQGK